MFDVLIKFLLGKAKDYFLRNYKTTLAAVIGAIAAHIPQLAPFKDAILTATVALVGVFAKDGDKTGTVAQPRDPTPVELAQPVADPVAKPPVVDYTQGG